MSRCIDSREPLPSALDSDLQNCRLVGLMHGRFVLSERFPRRGDGSAEVELCGKYCMKRLRAEPPLAMRPACRPYPRQKHGILSTIGGCPRIPAAPRVRRLEVRGDRPLGPPCRPEVCECGACLVGKSGS